jgi:hypothetical protein
MSEWLHAGLSRHGLETVQCRLAQKLVCSAKSRSAGGVWRIDAEEILEPPLCSAEPGLVAHRWQAAHLTVIAALRQAAGHVHGKHVHQDRRRATEQRQAGPYVPHVATNGLG